MENHQVVVQVVVVFIQEGDHAEDVTNAEIGDFIGKTMVLMDLGTASSSNLSSREAFLTLLLGFYKFKR